MGIHNPAPSSLGSLETIPSPRIKERHEAMAPNKAVLALAIVVMVLTASAAPAAADKEDCFCPCMRDKCMVIRGATREECARACTEGCYQLQLDGQPNENEFCGF